MPPKPPKENSEHENNFDNNNISSSMDSSNDDKELNDDMQKDSYQFVDKTCNTTHCSESLKLNGTTLYTVIFNN